MRLNVDCVCEVLASEIEEDVEIVFFIGDVDEDRVVTVCVRDRLSTSVLVARKITWNALHVDIIERYRCVIGKGCFSSNAIRLRLNEGENSKMRRIGISNFLMQKA